MSFSFSASGPADEVRRTIKNGPEIAVPRSLREFVLWGIHGAKVHYGADCTVTVSVSGHLCASADESPPTNASISIKGERAPIEEPVPELSAEAVDEQRKIEAEASAEAAKA